jgi:DNA-binding transcriptional ArsR family regulator
MMSVGARLQVVADGGVSQEEAAALRLDALFFALSDPIRRRILERLDGQALLVSELAAPFDISLQAVSRHIQVLVRAGLIQQERSGRISRCSLDAGPLLDAAVWMNRYSKYWQQQFDMLAATLAEIDARRSQPATKPPARKRTGTRMSRRTPRRAP